MNGADGVAFVRYGNRQPLVRMFGRIKDFRRIATRYDRLAQNFLAALCRVAPICYWLGVRTVGWLRGPTTTYTEHT